MSYLWRGPGHSWQCADKYGLIPKCPHCGATNIQRTHKNQITCGKMPCRDEQNRVTKRAALDRAKAKKAAAQKPESEGQIAL